MLIVKTIRNNAQCQGNTALQCQEVTQDTDTVLQRAP